MIVDKQTKGCLELSGKPNENWTGDTEKYWTVDSRTELAQKIREAAPFFEPVVEGNDLIDIIPTEKPEPEPTPEELQDEINLDFDFRITCLELGI